MEAQILKITVEYAGHDNPRVAIVAGYPGDSNPFEFTFLWDQWLAWHDPTSAVESVSDSFRRFIMRFCGSWRCYELSSLNACRGLEEISGRCYSVFIPAVTGKILARWVTSAVRAIAGDRYGSRTLTLSPVVWERITRRYGSGSGQALVEYQGREYAHLGNPPVTVTDAIARIPVEIHDTLKRITKSYTYRYDQAARCLVYPDLDGFNFQVYDFAGNPRLNGGIVNHGTETEPNWSIHT